VRRALGGAAGATVACALAAAIWGPACSERTCDWGPIPIYGDKFGEGRYLTEDTWESTPFDGKWLDYGALSGWNLSLGRWFQQGRPLVEMHAYISESQTPAISGNYTEATGNSIEFTHATTGGVWGYNNTCVHYYVRFVLRAGPIPPAPPPPGDAGGDVTNDAGDAASTDAEKE
jgi:hypothetical protein